MIEKNTNDRELYEEIISDMEEQVSLFESLDLGRQTIGQSWYRKVILMREKLQDFNNLKNFRWNNLAVVDEPSRDNYAYKWYSHLPVFLQYSMTTQTLLDRYKLIQEYSLEKLLSENPVGDVGNPLCFEIDTLRYTNRWVRHIYLFSVLEKFLGSIITEKVNVIMDIGSSYGALISIIKNNYPQKNIVLVDLPEQLAVAKYFLKSKFPETKITKFKDLKNCEKINRDFITRFDFVLIPCFMFDKIEKEAIDLTVNIASFNEMSVDWLNYYINAPVFKTSKYLFSVNRVIKEQNLGSKISILDLHLEEYDQMHFAICPYWKWKYSRNRICGILPVIEREPHPPFYEFIGKRKNLNVM